MQSEIDAAVKKIDGINKDLFSKAEGHLIESNRFGLEAEMKLVKKALDLENKGAPQEYIGEQYISILSMRIDDLNKYKGAIENDNYRNGVERSIEEARKLIKEIEFSYL